MFPSYEQFCSTMRPGVFLKTHLEYMNSPQKQSCLNRWSIETLHNDKWWQVARLTYVCASTAEAILNTFKRCNPDKIFRISMDTVEK